MNEAMPCPYCGVIGGGHVWAGTGSCPGTELVYVRRDLLRRAAEALEESTGNLGIVIPPAVSALIAELREAGK